MKKILLGLVVLSIFIAPKVYAGKLMFGVDESLHPIQEISGQNDGKKMFLGYRTSTRFFLLGVYVEDHGYVVYTPGEDKYLPLNETGIADLQKSGLIPTPLPKYKLSKITYIMGYSLWIFIIGLCLYYVVPRFFRKNKELAD